MAAAVIFLFGAVGEDVGDAGHLRGVDPEAGVLHAERLEDLRAQEHVERLARELLDEVALDVDAGSVAPVAAGLGGQRQRGQRGDHRPEIGPSQVGLGIPVVHVEAGGVAHQLPHRHRRGLRRHPVRGRHLEAGELGDVPGHRVVEGPFALFPEHHHGDTDDRLGHGGDAEDGVGGDRLLARQILNAVGVAVHDLAMPGDERRDTGELAVVDERAHRPLERLQPLGREADRLRGDQRIVRHERRGPAKHCHHRQHRHRPSSKDLHICPPSGDTASWSPILTPGPSVYLTRSQTTRRRGVGALDSADSASDYAAVALATRITQARRRTAVGSPPAKPCGGARSEIRQREKAQGIAGSRQREKAQRIRQSHGAAVHRSQRGYRSVVRVPEPGFAGGDPAAGRDQAGAAGLPTTHVVMQR